MTKEQADVFLAASIGTPVEVEVSKQPDGEYYVLLINPNPTVGGTTTLALLKELEEFTTVVTSVEDGKIAIGVA